MASPVKLLLLLVALGSSLAGQAQPGAAPVVRLAGLPPTGVVLERGWRYHPGDDPAWAAPDFDDRSWQFLNPALSLADLPAPVQRAGRGWLRVRLQAGAAARRQPLFVLVDQSVAAEWFWDGQPLAPRGDAARAFWTPLTPRALPLADPRPHVLAIRFALPAFATRANGTLLPPLFSLRVVHAAQLAHVLRAEAQRRAGFMLVLGVLALLTLLHLVLFAYAPARRANLFFAVATAGNALLALSFAYYGALPGALIGYFRWSVVHEWVVLLAILLALRALYAAFDVPVGRAYRGLWGLAVAGEALLLWHGPRGAAQSLPIYVPMLLLTGDQVRVSWGAWRRGQRGAGIVVAGFAVSGLTVLVALATETGLLARWSGDVPPLLGQFTRFFYLLGPAAALSFFLAREAALDRQLLQVKLAQVEKLSAEAAAQQQEKQRLLADRNQDLETEVGHRTAALQASLAELRRTQAQLVEREKLAALGALTAGIAHEIQNPLNFVTNFADVSAELVAELEDMRQLPARHAADEAELLGGLKQNLHTIRQHGQRAAAIVKGMLEHSRPSTGERGAVDLNALCREYLPLAYNGQQAKDPAFTAALRTEWAPDLPAVAGVAPDLGRVLLNLFANAFYAVRQRQRAAAAAGEAGYVPTLCVRTERVGAQVVVRVQDNGPGMAPAVQAQAFQPFFTTKPPGEGTGLGLSLSHDIVTRGHGGTLTVESTPGQGTEFCLALPV